MSKIHVGNLVEIRHWIVSDDDEDDKGKFVTQNRWQNVNPTKPVIYDGKNFGFLPFDYNDATRTRDRVEFKAAPQQKASAGANLPVQQRFQRS